jgi:hypothetical protein
MPDLTRKYFWLVTPLTRIEGTANRGERYAEMQAFAGLQLEAGQRAAAAALALAGHHDPSPIMTIESLFLRTTSNLLAGPPRPTQTHHDNSVAHPSPFLTYHIPSPQPPEPGALTSR